MADREEMLVIPYRQLSVEALRGLIEEFVTRHGTDSGYTRGSLEENVTMVRRQLDAGQALVVFDERSQTCNIVPAETLRKDARKPF
ncbi:YheU family protein [uncultured Desulfosarcina sp.]|uniref:YheU family protein n=1 Tax=uncultured Desulfosarcina sp. TaxID=218289 RepID=UPI0029C96399|nr:YheU family protein [uncultured Desulfosarcina sp.]